MYRVIFVLSSVHNYTRAADTAELLEQKHEEMTMLSVAIC